MACAVMVFAPSAAAQGAMPSAAAGCTGCHGVKGVATIPETPHLAGQPSGYLAAQLKAYRDGTRKHEVMKVAAGALSDADIEAIAKWFSEVKIEAK
jgi:cytochrome c553